MSRIVYIELFKKAQYEAWRRKELDSLPTIDAARIVCCEKCKYYIPYGDGIHCKKHPKGFNTETWICKDGKEEDEE